MKGWMVFYIVQHLFEAPHFSSLSLQQNKKETKYIKTV